MSTLPFERVLVTGGAGYVGSALVPALLARGFAVTVLDWFLYGRDVFDDQQSQPNLRQIEGDIRDPAAAEQALEGADAVIHLACISNDPSYDLNPALGESVNYQAFLPLVRAAKAHGVRRFIYASSSSVYGVRPEPDVTEEAPLSPLTDYSKFKALCETILTSERVPGFETVIVRPSTVCGYARRLRLDLVVNILTNHAIHRGKIVVTGGAQLRPNIHIADMVDAYLRLLTEPAEKVDGQTFNVGYQNHSVMELAQIVSEALGSRIPIEVQPTNDNRSYHVSSRKIQERLGFTPRRTIADAVRDLKQAFDSGRVKDPLSNSLYFNIRRMQEIDVR